MTNEQLAVLLRNYRDSIELVYERTSVNDFVRRANEMAERLRNSAHANFLKV